MKTSIRTAGLLLLSSLMLFSCKEEVKKDSFEVIGLKDSYDFVADLSQKETFTIESYRPWEITFNDMDWCDVTPIHDAGGTDIVTIFPDDNTSVNPREGSFTLTSGDYSKTVTIRQAGVAPELSVDVLPLVICQFSGVFAFGDSFNVTSNCDWAIDAPQWINLSVKSGQPGKTKVGISAAENPSEQRREGVIKISGKDISQEIIVYQDGKPSEYLEAAPSELSLGYEGGSKTIDVSSNTSWTVSSAVSWISFDSGSGQGDGKIVVNVQANSGSSERSADIEITTDAGTKVLIKANQEAMPAGKPGYVDYVVGEQYIWNATSSTYTSDPDWNAKGVKAADNSPLDGGKAVVYLEWLRADNGKDYSLVFSYDKGGLKLTGVYTGDGMVFHVPVKHIDAGRRIVLHFAMNLTGKKPQYWLAQYSLDEGKNWININTGKEYTTPGLKEYANIQIPVKSTQYDFALECPIAAAVDYKDVLIRVYTPDGTIDINGTDPSELPAASGTCLFANPEGYTGPTIEFL